MFPPIEPYKTHMLAVSNLHTLYIEESGNPNGQPVIYLHGGPGSESKPKHRQFYDPKKYRIICFHQRGCGQSTPFGELKENNTEKLIEDIEKIRKYFNIKKRVVTGFSRGSALAIQYAVAYPGSIKGIILGSIYTNTQAEIDRIFSGGAKAFFPQRWKKFVEFIPAKNKENVQDYCIQELYKKPIKERNKELARQLLLWDYALLKHTNEFTPNYFDIDKNSLKKLAIRLHYTLSPFPSDFIDKNIHKIKHIPAVIIQGRYDTCTPMTTAYKLNQARPESEFVVVPNGAHRHTDPSTTPTIIAWTEKFASI